VLGNIQVLFENDHPDIAGNQLVISGSLALGDSFAHIRPNSREWGQSKLRKESPDLTGPDKKHVGLLHVE